MGSTKYPELYTTTSSLPLFGPAFLTLEILASINCTKVNRKFPLKNCSQKKSKYFVEILDNPGFHWGNPRSVTR